MSAAEEWRPAPGFHGYSVSDRGGVRRDDTGRLLKPFPSKRTPRLELRRYLAVEPSVSGRPRMVTVHALVAAAFIGPRPAGMHIDHLNFDPSDNRVENLQYVTAQVNCQRRSDRRRIRCGVCGTPGHNRITCPAVFLLDNRCTSG